MRSLWLRSRVGAEDYGLGFLDATLQSVLHGLHSDTRSVHPVPGVDAAPRGIPGNETLAECGCRPASIFDLLAGDVHIRGSRRCCRR